MTTVARFQHEFVTSAPRELSPGVLYVSLEYCTMLHLCACGCGRKVVTPISPNDWSMTFNGNTVTVQPSIGSWSLPCRSHYLIKRGEVVWAGDWSDEKVKKGRAADLARKRGGGVHAVNASPPHLEQGTADARPAAKKLMQTLKEYLKSLFG